MKKGTPRKRIIIAVLLTLLSTVGCWDNKELDTISIVTGVGIDASTQKDKMDFTFQIGKVSENKSSQQNSSNEDKSFFILESTEKGILSAIESLKSENSRELFLHHNQLIIFGKDQAKKGVKPCLDAFLREHQMRMEVWVLVADGKAKDVLSAGMEQEKISAIGLDFILEGESRSSNSVAVSLLNFMSRVMDQETTPVAPIVKILKQGDDAKFVLSGMAIFKDNKLIGELPQDQISGYSWLMGNLNEYKVDVSTEYGYANLKVTGINIKRKPIFKEDGNPAFSIEIKGDMEIGEVQGFENINPEKCYDILQQAAKDEIKKEISNCYKKTQELNADVFGLGAAFYRSYPKQWRKMKGDWSRIYPETELSLNVQVKLVDTGKIKDFIK